MNSMNVEDWLLTAAERGNANSSIDRRRGDSQAWSAGNRVRMLIDGQTYFCALYDALRSLDRGDRVYFTDWEGDADEQLCGPGTEVGNVLAQAARRGVEVRGLLWRSHPRQAHFAEQDNIGLTKLVDRAGGEVMLDERVRRGGSHHQKLIVVRRGDGGEGDVAFVGGIDLCHGRRDDATHLGDEQLFPLSKRYGPRPPWHDVQLELRGPAVGDVELTFRERWDDHTPLDHRNPLRRAIRRATGQPPRPDSLPPLPADPQPCGTHTVQVLRTYPSKRPPYPFARAGERSVARAYLKAFARARGLVYVEDQFLWSIDAARALADALEQHPTLRVVAVVPRYPDRDGRAIQAAANIGRERATGLLRSAGGDRVAVYDLENRNGTPIYVHAKVCVIDDVWMVVGSDNLNRRSWTHDSEISCAVIDATRDDRAPLDPGALGDGARRLARDTRLQLWREHLQRDVGDDDDLVDPVAGFEVLARSAEALDQWYANGRQGPRPRGHLRKHPIERVGPVASVFALPVHRVLLDPDGRPRKLARHGRY